MLAERTINLDGNSGQDVLAGNGQHDLISIIIPIFNRAELVVDALESLLQQTHRHLQIIAIDDGSTDDTLAVMQEWSARHPDFRVDIVEQENSGVAAARNAGLRVAEGEFIFFLDSDDLVYPFALAELLEAMRGHPLAPFAVGHVQNHDLAGNIVTWEHACSTRLSEKNWLNNKWMTNAALYRRSAVHHSGQFDESLSGVGEDRELVWRIVAINGTGVLVNKVVGVRRHHELGHLSLDRGGPVDRGMTFNEDGLRFVRSALKARAAFATWIESRGLPRQSMSFSSLIHVIGLGFRAGRSGEDALRQKAFSLPQRLFKLSRPVTTLVGLLGAPQSRIYYRCAFFVFRGLRRAGILPRP